MSTRYDICCETCGEIFQIGENNYADELMLRLCAHADELAAMADTLQAIGGRLHLDDLAVYESIDVSWFKRHLGHELIPIDEYGRKLDACNKYKHIQCEGGYSHYCGLKRDHDGDCKLTHNSNPFNARKTGGRT